MSWCFAIVNNKLAEIYFNNGKKNSRTEILGHCYVSKEDYKTKRERRWIAHDMKRVKVVYRDKKYKICQK